MRRRPGRATSRRWRSSAALAVVTATAITACTQSADRPAAEPQRTAGPTSSAPTGSAAPGTGSAPEAPPSLGPVDAVRTVVLADEVTRPPAAGAPAWPDLLASTLEGIGIPMAVETTVADGAGFASSPSFTDLVAQHAGGSTQLVVLFDGHLADGAAASLAAAVREGAEAVERASPDAELVVVGPLPSEGPAESRAARIAALREATEEAGGTFVDPVLEGWPTDITQQEMADSLRLHVQPVTESLAASGANR